MSLQIASRQPTAKGSQSGYYGQPDLASMKLNPESYEQDIGLFKNANFYPNFRPGDFHGSTDQSARTVIDQLKANLKFMYGFADKHSQVWYDGARALVDGRLSPSLTRPANSQEGRRESSGPTTSCSPNGRFVAS